MINYEKQGDRQSPCNRGISIDNRNKLQKILQQNRFENKGRQKVPLKVRKYVVLWGKDQNRTRLECKVA